MPRIEITMEKTLRVAMEFNVTEKEIEQLQCGENPFYEQMERELETGDVEYDYSVVNMDTGKQIVDWD